MQRVAGTATIVVATDADQIIQSLGDLNGILRGIIVVVPDLKATGTLDVDLKDADGNVLFTKSNLAESATYAYYDDLASDAATYLPMGIPLAGVHSLTLTTDVAQDVDTDIDYVLLIERG